MRPLLSFVSSIILIAAACSDGPTSAGPTNPTPPPPQPPGVPTLVIVSGDGQTGDVGTVLPQPLVLKLTNSLGAPAVAHLITFSGVGGVVEDSVRTDSLGIASAHWRLGMVAFSQTLVAQAFPCPDAAYGSARVIISARATPSPPALIASAGDSAVALPGTVLDTLVIAVTDRFHNPVPGVVVMWSVEAGGGSVLPLATETSATGYARALWTIGPTPGANTLAVTSGSLTTQFTATATAPFSAALLSAGDNDTCAMTSAGVAYCWGATANRKVPTRVGGDFAFASLVAANHYVCGLTRDGDAYCWGPGFAQPLTAGLAGGAKLEPIRVAAGLTFSALAVAADHICGLTFNGHVYCWGDNRFGQLGDSSLTGRSSPAPIAGTVTFASISAGDAFSCGLSTAGDTYCWGTNESRQLGVEVTGKCNEGYDYFDEPYYTPCSNAPVRVTSFPRLTALAASGASTCGLTATAQILCWGSGTMTQFSSAAGFTAIAVGAGVCGLETSGTVLCWPFGGGGSGPTTLQPPAGAPAFANLTGSPTHFCGVSRAAPGIAYCWGDNRFGQLGDGTTRNRSAPVPVVTPIQP